MPITIKRPVGPITFELAYYNELLMSEDKGCLSRELACHALWHYYGMAMCAHKQAKENIVYDDEPSIIFDISMAQNLLHSTSNMYGTPIEDMVKYWPMIEKQRVALGGGDSLPSEFKFQFSMRN